MRQGAFIAGVAAAVALLAVADTAAAQTARGRTVSLTEAQAARSAGNQTGQTRLRFTERGRWGLDLNMTEPSNREAAVGGVEAGAYYRVNPRLRVGAAAGIEEGRTEPDRPAQEDRRAARFRLQSIFRF